MPKYLCLLLFTALVANAQQRRSLGQPVNTPQFNEYAPSVSADEKTMIFESDRGVNGRWELFSTVKNDKGRWTPPKALTKINEVGKDNDLIGGPSISYDGNTLYFFASFDGGKGDMDIYVSTREANGEWAAPKNLGTPINTERYEGFPSVSADGSKIYFIRDNFSKRKDQAICYTIWVSTKKEDGTWGEPEKLPAPINMDCEKSPRIMADGKTLIFSSIRKEGFGGFDLYQSYQEDDGTWAQPVNLDYINTAEDDQFGSVAASCDLMYSQVAGDIFTVTIPEKLQKCKTVALGGKLLDFITKQDLVGKIVIKSSNPKERPQTVISKNGRYSATLRPGNKYSISVNNQTGYFAYNTQLLADKGVAVVEKDLELVPTKLPFQFQCYDKETKAVLKNPKVKILDVETKQITEATVKDDIATAILEIGRSYKFSASAPEVKVGNKTTKYSFFARPFKPDSTEVGKDRLKRVPLTPLKVNEPIQLNDVTFETAKADLRPESFDELDRMVKLLEENPDIKVEISAHTDDVGNDDSNMKLSDRRAKSVTDYVVSKGIKADRLTSKGYGETQPLVPNDSDESRAKNRRVQFKIAQ